MPILRFFLLIISFKRWILFHLKNKSNFGWITEIWDRHMTNFVDEALSWKFELVFTLFDEVFQFECLELHDVSNTKSLKVLTLIKIAQNILHVKCNRLSLKLFVTSQFVQIHNNFIIVVAILWNIVLFVGSSNPIFAVSLILLWLFDPFLVRYHSLLHFCEDRQQLLRSFFNVRHGLF